MTGVLADLLAGKTDFIKNKKPRVGLKPPPAAAAAAAPKKSEARLLPPIKREEAPPPIKRETPVAPTQPRREAQAEPPQKRRREAQAEPPQKRQRQAPPAAGLQVRERPKCTGRAAEALEVFRKLEAKKKGEGKSKPDMKAYKELRAKYTVMRHGEIPDVPVGLVLYGRGEAAILGIHTRILQGIDARKDEPCYAVCISGGYKDDDDTSPDGTIIYTGCGGQNKHKRQVEDQKENVENVSLMHSIDSKVPVRVLRGRLVNKRPEYVYEGLYTCVEYDYVASEDGPKVYKFTLKPIDHEKARSFEVDFDPSRGTAAGASAGSRPKAGSSRDRIEKKIGKKQKGGSSHNSWVQESIAERLKRPAKW